MSDLCLFTTGKDLTLLRDSCTSVGIELQTYNTNPHVFKDWLTTKTAEGLAFLRTRTEKYAMWVDGHDSLVIQPEAEIMERFLAMNSPVVIAGEKNCWPHSGLAKYFKPRGEVISGDWSTIARFPNAGGYIGYRESLIQAMQIVLETGDESGNDQGAWQKAMCFGSFRFPVVRIDQDRRIFASIGDGDEALKSDSCVKHWNGASPGREEWWRGYVATS